MRAHTYQQQLATPVPDSTPPEHRPNTDDTPGTWDHLENSSAAEALAGAQGSGPRVNGE